MRLWRDLALRGASACACMAALACGGGVREDSRAVAAGPIRRTGWVPTVVTTTSPAETPVTHLAAATGRLKAGQIAGVLGAMNRGEVQQAQLALSRTRNPDVALFARTMVKDHTDGQALVAQAADSAHAAEEASAAQEHAQAAGQQVTAELLPLSGTAFDAAYVDEQVVAHQEALATIDHLLLPDVRNADLRAAIQALRGKVEEHLSFAIQVRAKLRGG